MLRDYDARGVSAAAARVVEDFKTNRWDATSDLLIYTPAQVLAFRQLENYYHTGSVRRNSRRG